MIGQRELLHKIDGQIQRGKFPKASILIGETGSGRTTLAKYIADELDYGFHVSQSEEDVKKIYKLCYKVSPALPMVYIFRDCDSMSDRELALISGILENIPENSYIILTCEALDNIPLRIKNKVVTYMMEPYSNEDKLDFIYDTFKSLLNSTMLSEEKVEFILDVATNIGEVKQMCFMDIKALKKFVMDIIVSTIRNSHENTPTIAFRGEDDLFPLRLLMKSFNAVCGDLARTQDDPVVYGRFIAITEDLLQGLSYKDVNEEAVYGTWMFELYEEAKTLNG